MAHVERRYSDSHAILTLHCCCRLCISYADADYSLRLAKPALVAALIALL